MVVPGKFQLMNEQMNEFSGNPGHGSRFIENTAAEKVSKLQYENMLPLFGLT